MRLFIRYFFFTKQMRSVVGGNGIQHILIQCVPKGFAVVRRLDSGIAFYEITQPRIIIAAEVQVVYTDFSRDTFFCKRHHIAE